MTAAGGADAAASAAPDPAIEEPVVLVPHDPAWFDRYAAERARLVARFGTELIDVQHIGSTAVAGLPAKPIVDIIAGVASMAVADALFEPLLGHGYTTSRAFNDMLPDRRWFMRSAGGRRTHHLHVVVHDGPLWRSHLRFRDRLRADPALAARYADLKHTLAERHRHDREAYTDAKSAFIAAALAAA